jgi:hypothetical protein
MAKGKKVFEEPVEQPEPVKVLTDEEKALIVEEYLGVHPKYFIYTGNQITVNDFLVAREGKHFNGFLPHLKELGML